LREVHDVDVMSDERDDGIGGDYLQLDSRAFCARWIVLTLPRLVLRFTREDVASLHRIYAPTDKWLVFMPLRTLGGVRWDGCVVTPGSLIVCPPASESLVCHGGGTEFAIVSFAAPAAARLVDAIREKLTSESAAEIIEPPLAEVRALAGELIAVRATLRLCPETMTCDECAETECRLDGELNRCLRQSTIEHARRATIHSRGSIVRRAEAFFREHLGEAVSISQLSTVVGVSERSLRNAFYEVCTTSPKKYLRLWQLHQVRRTLRSAPSDHAAVTTAATRHGFYELGRFAVQYRTVFGEPPSVTLHRARHEPSVGRPA
jgi:AraC family ethanolamine operon transcriptional activator